MTLKIGDSVSVAIEKPVAGGRMIARVNGQIVLVADTIPGEQVVARIDRVAKGVAYASAVAVEVPSSDRVAPPGDPQCGGCLYAHIAAERQRAIKAQVIGDAFARIARAPLTVPVTVMASPADGYRMRARLHRRGPRLGFFREGTHELCDARQTRQLLPASCDVLDRVAADLSRLGADDVAEVEVAENLDGSDRVVHLHTAASSKELTAGTMSSLPGVTGITVSEYGSARVLSGSPYVTDRVALGAGEDVAVRRHVLAFFQGNRYLLRDLAANVAARIPPGSAVLDLYAGGGLFAMAAALGRGARVTAVEGDRVAAADLVANAASAAGGIAARHRSVEAFVASASPGADAIIVDPPRTGLSRDALAGIVRLAPRRLIYVSCDVATLARDTRTLIDAGYLNQQVQGFDLFPVTAHVEVVVTFEK
jgi:tRNA/tmRNA/rRNA uracil-C5-methylase (TrmA/RlmC/RlmD family)